MSQEVETSEVTRVVDRHRPGRLAAIAMSIVVLAGCSDGQQQPTGTDTTEPEAINVVYKCGDQVEDESRVRASGEEVSATDLTEEVGIFDPAAEHLFSLFAEPFNELLAPQKIEEIVLLPKARDCEDSQYLHTASVGIDRDGYYSGGFLYAREINIAVPPHQKWSVGSIRIAVTHESFHIVHNEIIKNNLASSRVFIENYLNLLAEKDPDRSKKIMEDWANDPEDDDKLLFNIGIPREQTTELRKNDGSVSSLFIESSYGKSGGNAGHFWDGVGELVASTGTILYIYPEKFMEKINRIEEPSKKELALKIARDFIDMIRANTSDPAVVDKFFDPKLMKFLGNS